GWTADVPNPVEVCSATQAGCFSPVTITQTCMVYLGLFDILYLRWCLSKNLIIPPRILDNVAAMWHQSLMLLARIRIIGSIWTGMDFWMMA
ncbi:MAG: hypothetical protein K8I00_04755, partial [Candidatus Omnitrophica bacterium]|nr:hypothetical protein [Candidatus Omnitrophota bacterium]